MKKVRIAIFCSGSGSNAEAIFNYFQNKQDVEFCGLLSNKPDAYALERAKSRGISSLVVNREQFYGSTSVVQWLLEKEADIIVLAGFLWLVPSYLLDVYPNRIINIHPALLPKFGGKGMYGHFVHEAVSKSGDTETGCTIHLVNQEFDKGEIILQAKVAIQPFSNPLEIAALVLKLEHANYPIAIERLVNLILAENATVLKVV